jgi:hypothetical protein
VLLRDKFVINGWWGEVLGVAGVGVRLFNKWWGFRGLERFCNQQQRPKSPDFLGEARVGLPRQTMAWHEEITR